MINTGPISNDQFKELSLPLSLPGDSVPEESRNPTEPEKSSIADISQGVPIDRPDPPHESGPEMIDEVLKLMTSHPDLAARVHRLESGQMFSVEG